ncbi:MAG: hypothetical protein AAB150_02810 [Pseudomonadota bacterium]
MADFARVHSGAHLLLGMIVVRAGLLMIKESEHLVSVTTQALDDAFGIGIVRGSGDELVEAQVKFCPAPRVNWWRTDLPLISRAPKPSAMRSMRGETKSVDE